MKEEPEVNEIAEEEVVKEEPSVNEIAEEEVVKDEPVVYTTLFRSSIVWATLKLL